MVFEKLNKDYDKAGIDKKEINERARTIEDLASFSVKHDNPFYFVDFGSNDNLKINESNRIKKEIFKDLDEEGIEWVKNGLEVFHSFVESPIFTDSFHEDNPSREDWKEKYLNELDQETLRYYKSNRLRTNRWHNIEHFLGEIENSVRDVDLKEKLKNLKDRIPLGFFGEDKPSIKKYKDLSDEEKIEDILKLTEIVNEAINLLEEKQS